MQTHWFSRISDMLGLTFFPSTNPLIGTPPSIVNFNENEFEEFFLRLNFINKFSEFFLSFI